MLAAYSPSPQYLQLSSRASKAWNVPAAHFVHAVIFDAEYKPAAHALQKVEPAFAEYLPEAQPMHKSEVAPSTGEYQPARHLVQLV